MSATQASLFDLLAAAPPAATPASARAIHWLVITTRRARTACGIPISAYYHANRSALPDEGELIRCTPDRDDGTVTCPRCLEEMR